MPETGASRKRIARATRAPSVRIAGAGADHNFSRPCRHKRALDDILHLVGREHGNDNGVALPRDLCGRSGASADLHKPFRARRIDVKAHDTKPRGDQALRVDFSHQADADQADGCLWGHGSSFLRLGDLLIVSCDQTADKEASL